MSKRTLGLGLVVLLAVFLLGRVTAPAQTSVPWFSVSNGDTTCKGTKITGSVIKFSLWCGNARGAFAGSYTGIAPSGIPPTGGTLDSIQFSINSMTTPSAGGINCSLWMNGTGAIANGVAPLSVNYQCDSDKRTPGNMSWTAAAKSNQPGLTTPNRTGVKK